PESAILAVEDDGNSDEYTVLVAEFETDDEAVVVEDITVTASSTNGLGSAGTTTLDKMIRTVTLVIDGQEYSSDEENDTAVTGTYTFEDIDHVFDADERVEVAVVVEFLRADGTIFRGDGSEFVQFAIYGADIEAETESSGEDVTPGGSAEGNQHSLM